MKAAVPVLLGLMLAGCAAPDRRAAPLPAEADPAAAHLERVGAFHQWRLSGRIAVQRDDQGVTADVDWQQDGERFDLRIMAPLNGGTFRLAGDAATVVLQAPDGAVYQARDAETLLQDHLGWSLPLDGARYWIRGLQAPTPAPAHAVADASGRWTDFEQAGWRVSVLDYVQFEDLDLPRRLFLARNAVKVRIVVKQWERR